jgi:TonB family protein
MMSAYANSVQKPERFDTYVRKFRAICMMHGVQTGSRKELPVFLRKLIDDRHLAMDFWGFIGKLSDREDGPLSDDQMLDVIIEGITDCDVSEVDGGALRTIHDLRAMLAGVDIQGSEYREVEIAPFPKSDLRIQEAEKPLDTPKVDPPKVDTQQVAGQPDKKQEEKQQDKTPDQSQESGEAEKELDRKLRAHAEELAARPPRRQIASTSPEAQVPPVEKPTYFGSAPDEKTERREPVEKFAKAARPGNLEEELPYAPVLPATPAPQLDEALLRLELTKLVQQYFDNIDKRISKLEPAAEGTIAPPVTRRSLEEPVSDAEMEELRLRRMGKARLVLEPAAAPDESPGALLEKSEGDDIPMRVPLEHYSPPPIYGRAPFLLLLLTLGAGFAIYHDPTILRKGVSFVARQFHTDSRAASSSRTETSAPPSAPTPPAVTGSSEPSILQSALQGASAAPAADTPGQNTSVPASQPAAAPQPAGGSQSAGNEPDSNHKTVTDRVVAQTEQAIADGISSIESAGAVRVSPSVMDENLIVQRVPAYPESAKSSGVQGEVVMQALISKEGTVKRVHVVEGDSRLRTAAEEAVYKWRYRPYVLHGQPVEVATTVTVNFNLNR